MVKNRFYRFIRATWRPFVTFLHPLRVEGLELSLIHISEPTRRS